MNWIEKISFYQNIRGEEPNKALAKEIVAADSVSALQEISEYLFDKNKSVTSDVLATMYHVGYEKPELICPYRKVFLKLLKSKNNRMVWGSMIALSTIAKVEPQSVFKNIELVIDVIKSGSLITEVWGIVTLVNVVISNRDYEDAILPILWDYLQKCRPIDFAKRVETMLPIIKDAEQLKYFQQTLEEKSSDLTEAQLKKLKTIIRRYNKTKKGSFILELD